MSIWLIGKMSGSRSPHSRNHYRSGAVNYCISVDWLKKNPLEFFDCAPAEIAEDSTEDFS